MASVSLLFLGFIVLAGEVISEQSSSNVGGTEMEEDEILGLFEVLGALLEDHAWAEMHPKPCTETPWPGIQCEIGQDPPIFHVTKIHLGPEIINPPCKSSANLSESILKLPFLRTLSIFNCFVSSPVTLSPTLFGAASSLEHLALLQNPALSGEIPLSIAEVAGLRVLTLAQNNLQGEIPGEIGGLVKLEQLDLSRNKFSGEIPEEIGGLNGLTILDLSSNAIEGPLPSSLGQLSNLQKIDFSSNRLVGRMPPELGNLNRLTLFDLTHNMIHGPLPETLSGMENLEYLVVDYNPVNTGLPSFLGTLKKLRSLSFSGCGLTGLIPNSITTLENLSALALDNNSLSGTIPTDFGVLPNLDQLNVSRNRLSGRLELPEEFIFRLRQRLDVRGNAGLCASNRIHKNISDFLEIPVCSNATGPLNDGTSANERPDDYERMKPSPYHDKMSSNAPWMHQKLTSIAFAFAFCCLFSDFLVVHLL